MYTYDYPRPMLAVDVVVFHPQNDQLHILLIQRAHCPFTGAWALPGGFVEMKESLEMAAARELAEETGLTGCKLQQVHTYGDPHRDPRGRVISVAYCTFLPAETPRAIKGGGDANQARWFPLSDLPELAFDHLKIIDDAYKFILDQMGYFSNP
jgi:8-oxo-dGTP diphosphatase